MASADDTDERIVPLLPLRGLLVFPAMVLHLDVGRERSVRALDRAMVEDHILLLATQKDSQEDEPDADGIFSIGTLARIKQMIKLPNGTIRVLVEGIKRAEILSFENTDDLFRVQVREMEEETVRTPEIDALVRALSQQFEQYLKISKKHSPEIHAAVSDLEDPGRMADAIAANLSLKIRDKQTILEATDVKTRIELLLQILSDEREILELEKKIGQRVRKQMERTQKEYYLREQMKAIQKELGEKEGRTGEVEELRDQLAMLQLPEAVLERVEKELDRLERIPPSSAEGSVVRTYVDWLMGIPWTNETPSDIDLSHAQKVLDEDHYGLEKVKERIIEYLAVKTLVEVHRGPILCLVGPPGVGKTSLAKSVARALGRKFVRISLGGVRDEAEIRGHRRTYIGALPGRLIQGMKTASVKNPVFLLDEIDKMASDFRGDPASAMLEVLDPEQNSTFSDHYIELPYDLSNVMFITTANGVHGIPQPLLDRMETIYVSGYTEVEKLRIAMDYLLPKQRKAHGLTKERLAVSEETMLKLIREYTREAGVRNLERQIAALCRKAAKIIVSGEKKRVVVSLKTLPTYLGPARFRYGMAEAEDQVGVATGLAWTEAGGDTLAIEVSVVLGKGKLTITGQLGDVMKESAQAALSYVRSRARELSIPDDFIENHDIHIHVPEGAIPKDGPSAGITLATALASALTGRAIRRDVAMTGEITLRGRVLPIGGVKEKCLSAHRAGIKTVLLPRDNAKDMEDIPETVRQHLHLVFVEHMDQVLENALRDQIKT
ncbi:endopeptidase La [Ferroacidibacillus organovorans]|uniref:Lon protease n=1 Tax=Ferroacidibacillus organovorans TaxID=1765683 RepID=A0A101XSH2_9BACL|nr:endopeptidase La [Ferroacidibacillus organovorans]KUO96703.1 DNA-binding protein [Ferroacidibacillus organovorans]